MLTLNLIQFLLIFILKICYLNCQYNLLVLGDTGQFEEFLANKGNAVDNDSTLFTLTLDDGSKRGTCKKVDGTDFVGFKNFKSVIESDKNSDLRYFCNADQIVVLGDVSYPEIDKNYLLKKESVRYPGFKNRLICMWYELRNVWDNAASQTCPQGSTAAFKSKTSDGKYDNLVILTGNHSFDVDIDIEAAMMSSFVANKATYFDGSFTGNTIPSNSERSVTANDVMKWPSISVRTKNGVRVEFLDYNVYPLYCYLNAGKISTKYNDCFYAKILYGIFPSFSDAETYTKKFIQALSSFTTGANWRVLRSHNPIFSVEGGSLETQQFFNIVVDDNGNTILDLIKAAKVNLILTSHNHFGQFQVFPWDQLSNLKSKYLTNTTATLGANKVVNVDGSDCTPDSNGFCKYQCYYNDKYLGGYTEDYSCSNQNFNLKLNPQNPANLLMFLIGFSGRKFDPIQSDQRTASTVIFDRGQNGDFGGTYINFYDKYLVASVFAGGKNIITLTTTYTDTGKDNYTVLNGYVSEKLSGVYYTNNSTFNYSKYNNTNNSSFMSVKILCLILITLFLF